MGRHIRDNTDAAAQEADDRITEEGTQPAPRYEIFGTSTCPYCDKAKELLTAIGAQFVFFNIDEDEQAFDQLVGRIKSWKTVPQIFYGATHIGGYDDLLKVRAIWNQSVTSYATLQRGYSIMADTYTDVFARIEHEKTAELIEETVKMFHKE